MITPQKKPLCSEDSDVTTLRPVPAKSARLLDLAESDSTTYFSATELLERGKALVAQASDPAPPPPPKAAQESEISLPSSSPLAQFRRASPAKKACALLLPAACAMLLLRPVRNRSASPVRSKPSASVAASNAPALAPPAVLPPSASVAPLVLARGMTVAHAAADSVATGDFSRAAALYRELSLREPQNRAYREAARILSERATAKGP